MDLDNLASFQSIDTVRYINEIDGLPDQLKEAWDLGGGQGLPIGRAFARLSSQEWVDRRSVLTC